jgi:hypothetical protein
LAEILKKMSGRIEFYKIDKLKITENLLPIISDKTLPPRETNLKYAYDDPDEYILESFEKWIILKNRKTEYFKTSYNAIFEKIKVDFFLINFEEFHILLDWLTWYFGFEYDNDETFLDNLGIIEIGDLHSREEMTIFYLFGEYGINEFDHNLHKINNLWNEIETPFDSKKMIQVINFLTLILINIIGDNYILNIEEKDKEFVIELLKNNALKNKSLKFIQSNFTENKLGSYKENYNYLTQCAESYLYKMLSLKNNIGNYTGLIYRLDNY